MNAIGPAPVPPPRRLDWPRMLGLTLAVFALGCLGVFVLARPVDIRVTQQQAQAALDAKLGEVQRGGLGVSVLPERLDIAFTAKDGVTLDLDMQVEGFRQSARVDGRVSGTVDYRAPNIHLSRLDTDGIRVVPDMPTNSRIADYARIARDRLAAERAKLEGADAREAFDRRVETDGGELRDLAATLLTRVVGAVPLYDVRDAGVAGRAAGLALTDVRFEDGAAVVTLDPRLALLKILGFLATCLLAALWAFQTAIGNLLWRLVHRNDPAGDAP